VYYVSVVIWLDSGGERNGEKKKRRKKGSRHMGVYFAPGGRDGISSPKDLYPSSTFFDFRKSAE